MDDPVWVLMSAMLAMLSIGQSSMMLLSKVIGLSERKIATFISKLIECASLLALAMATGTLLWTYQSAHPPTQDELDQLKHLPAIQLISSALHIYYQTAIMAVVAFALLYSCFRLGRVPGDIAKVVGFTIGLFGFGLISLAIIPQVQIAYPKPNRGMDYFFYGAFADLILAGIVMFFGWATRPRKDTGAVALRASLRSALRSGGQKFDSAAFWS